MLNNFTKNSIITDIGKIIYYKRGDGPPVLLLHGYPQFSLMWEETALLLSDKYTTIIPDLRGYGESAKPKGLPDHSNYSKRAMANDHIQIMDNLKISNIFCGWVMIEVEELHIDYVEIFPIEFRKMVVLDICPNFRHV